MLFVGLGIAMFLEGLPYFVSPHGVRRYMVALSRMSEGTLRVFGLALILVGLAVVYLATR
jgi:uncharacterized protein YjeT (DUF2065 family)